MNQRHSKKKPILPSNIFHVVIIPCGNIVGEIVDKIQFHPTSYPSWGLGPWPHDKSLCFEKNRRVKDKIIQVGLHQTLWMTRVAALLVFVLKTSP